MTKDVYAEAGYGQQMIGFGNSPGIVVIDFMRTFTDSNHPLAGKPMVMRALENTAKLLKVARRSNVPVANCYTAYANKRAMPRFKITTVDDSFLEGHPHTQLDSRIHDPDYDVVVCKTKPSIFLPYSGRALLHPGKRGHGDCHRLLHQRLRPGLHYR